MRNAADFAGADIGAKINAAIDDFSANEQGIVVVPSDSWGGVSYSTQIVLDKPIKIIFPGANTVATYTGTGSALKITAGYVSIEGFAVNQTGNINANVDGILVDGTAATVASCRVSDFYINDTVRHGINLDANDNGIFYCAFENGRVLAPGGNNIHLETSGTIKANANTFSQIAIGSTPASFNGIRIVDGYANSFSDIYIEGGNATAWGVYTSGDYELFSNLTLDSSMTLGFKIDAGLALITGIRNNASGTAETVSGTGAVSKLDFSGHFLPADGSITNKAYAFNSDPDLGWYLNSGVLTFGVGTTNYFVLGANNKLRSTSCYQITTGEPNGTVANAYCSDGAGIAAFRNGTNAQELRVYTTDNGSNDEYFSIKTQAAGNTQIGNVATGTGTERSLEIVSPVVTNGNIPADGIAFADTDGNFTATNVGAAIEELDDVNGSGPNAADGKVNYTQLVDVPAFRKTLYQLRPQAYEPPASSFATLFSRNGHPGLSFDGDVCAAWTFVMPNTYGGNGVTVDVWVVSTETSNDTDWDGSWERIATMQDIDSDSFATAVSADNNNNNATSGIPTKVSIAFTDGAQMDSCAADELCRFRLCRDATSDTGGTTNGQAVMIGGQIRETP